MTRFVCRKLFPDLLAAGFAILAVLGGAGCNRQAPPQEGQVGPASASGAAGAVRHDTPLKLLVLQDVSESVEGAIPPVTRSNVASVLLEHEKRGGESALGVFGTRAPPLLRVRFEPPLPPTQPAAMNVFERAAKKEEYERDLKRFERTREDFQVQSEASRQKFLNDLMPLLARRESSTDLHAALERASVFFSEPSSAGTRKVLVVVSDFVGTNGGDGYELPDDVRVLAVTNDLDAVAKALGPRTLESVEIYESPAAALQAAVEAVP